MYESETLTLTLGNSGFAELCFNAPGSVNKLDLNTLDHLEQALVTLKENEESILGLTLSSAKENFIVGADITQFLGLFALPEAELSHWLEKTNNLFCLLEDLPFPTISAITGFCLGGGMELVLTTDFRIADSSAQIGLPETKLGIMPGFGGTVRLPRVIGADNALEWITTGRAYKAKSALAVGAIDAVISEPNQLLSAATEMLEDAVQGKLQWEQRRAKKLTPLSLKGVEAFMSFNTAKAMISAKVGSHYPAPIMAVNTIAVAAELNREKALAKELEGFIQLTRTDVAQALVGIFLNDQYIKSIAKKAAKRAKPVTQGAVLGAGIMGGGIAYQGASKGTPMVMKDIDPNSLELGLAEASKLLLKQVERGRIKPTQVAQALNHITPALHYEPLADSSIVVEAVVEHPKVKAQVLAEIESAVSSDCIIASNTSTISINQLASALNDPSRFCGMHFFNPVHRMPLVEVIRGENSSNETIATVVSWAAQLGKSPIVVNDCPGFFVNRVLFPYFQGFTQLIRDGVNFEQIDKVMEQKFGWPMGPAYLLDVVGIDTAHHARQVMAEGYPERMTANTEDAIEQLFLAERYGQKNGKGFYLYQPDAKGKPQKHHCEGAAVMFIPTPSNQLEDEVIIARMMIPMILEAVRCLEEGVIASPAEADMALVYGLGFPPFRGGVFRYIEILGLSNFVALADQYAELGPLYHVTPQLREMASKKQSYFATTASH